MELDRTHLDRTPSRHEAIGRSEEFLDLQERIRRVAPVDRAVLLIGERGTGKELAAERIHLLSERWNKPYVTLNCASLSPSLIESELFGHEAGAFTGASHRRPGRFELADGGTLFLDEIADLPRTAQEKILRVVEYGRFERVGGEQTVEADVRLVAATNVDLRQYAHDGKFRQDLLDRLSFEVITLPPLRARSEDIAVLTEYFARRMAAELERETAPRFSRGALRQLQDYDWPGNIRELKNVVERMVYRSGDAVIDHIDFDPFDSAHVPRVPSSGARSRVTASSAQPSGGAATATSVKSQPNHDEFLDTLNRLPLKQALELYCIARLSQALRANRFNQKKAAQALGLTYDQFRSYYRKYASKLASGHKKTDGETRSSQKRRKGTSESAIL